MKKIKYVLLIILLMIGINVKAEEKCDSKEFARVKEIAKKVEFDYDYELVGGEAIFSINAINLNDDIKVRIVENYYDEVYKEFTNTGENRGKLEGFKSGERVTITISAYVPNWCSGKKITTKTIKLPYYNYYYSEEKCKGNEDFKYCKKLIGSKISEETFERELASYIKNKNKTEPVTQEEDNNTLKYIIIGVVSIIVAIGAIVLIMRNITRIRKKNSL